MGDDARDGMGDGAWMTYDELAVSRGFTRRAAVRLTQRQRLRRQPGNDGLVRVWVPSDMARPSQRRSQRDDGGDDARDTGLMRGALAALEDAITGLREQLDVANARAERAEASTADERAKADALHDRIDTLQRDLDAMRTTAQKAQETAEEGREGERARADALRDRLNAMQEQLADSHAALQAAESANARAVQAEQDKERAETAITGERQRADALRDRLDGMQHDLDAARERMQFSQAALDQAQGEARKARGDAEALRKADTDPDTDRKARGLAARLRAAWRGE